MGRRHGRFRRIRNRRVGEHAERSARRSSGHQPQPRRTAVSPVSRRDQLAARHQRDVGGTHRRVLRLPGVVVDPPAQPALAADRRDRSLLRRRAGPAGQLGDFRRLRSTGRALPTVVAVLQRLSATRADAVIPRRLRELLRADRARPALDPSPFHRTADLRQLARPASARRRVRHRIRCGAAPQRGHAVHVVEGGTVRLHRGGWPRAARVRQRPAALHGDL